MMYRQNIKSSHRKYNSEQCLVLELGAFSIKAGYGGENKPCLLEPTVQ